jgi:hypothetical protein
MYYQLQIRDEDRLYFRGSNQGEEELFAESNTGFFGNSEDIGEFHKDQKGTISHFVVQVGFGFWQFNKIGRWFFIQK